MNKRLLTISKMINNVKCMYDVGSDHAFLSIYLIKNKIVDFIINFEINEQPLKNGYSNVKKEGLLNQIFFVLNDGLKNYYPKVVPKLVNISGLGANTMMEIIENTNFYVQQWILQPNNNSDKLRAFMLKKGYDIVDEAIVLENGIYYEIIKFVKQNFIAHYNDYEIFFGPVNLFKNVSNLKEKINLEYQRYLKLNQNKISIELQKRIFYIKKLLHPKKGNAHE